jgi:hypothetical protein
MMTNAMSAQGQSPAARRGGDGEQAIREKLRRLIEEAMAARLAGAG